GKGPKHLTFIKIDCTRVGAFSAVIVGVFAKVDLQIHKYRDIQGMSPWTPEWDQFHLFVGKKKKSTVRLG
ncbi:hypothetical protein PJP10_31675, partial [Mycobacterium kansasii]